MPSAKSDDFDKQKLDEAWAKLQAKLAEEPAQPKWAEWNKAGAEWKPAALSEEAAGRPADEAELDRSTVPVKRGELAAETGTGSPGEKRARTWLTRKRKQWIGFAAACCVFGAFIATPAGNEALASILNKFRMQDVTVVQKDDLQQFFNQFAPDGTTREQINKFGTFTQSSGTQRGQLTLAEAEKALGRKLMVPAEYKEDPARTLYVAPSNKLTLQLHVDEVNQALKRLGAKKLLPASVDGKPITLELGETVNYHLGNDQKKEWYSFAQTAVPVITVDPSIPVAQALNAVLDFPLLPGYLKQSLQQSSILSGGNIPLPVIADGTSEKVNVGGTQVIVTTNKSRESTYYFATWVKNGQLYNFGGGNRYTNQEAVLAKVKELIGS
ncbi:hypothetical protein O9H85_02185 [Paenibacillus filicis]|uniref:DUF4367 domain-containing protein n=1 Tax=Paenibacillus gyeongsangnamensis TaxID=3388067 RepID=A0ABT4Q316_9BACL|nr:hypothetical protein [Paenibacillus filicis]MCZ8511268.1 hypothetical protein [Paenibacillus filicis]